MSADGIRGDFIFIGIADENIVSHIISPRIIDTRPMYEGAMRHILRKEL